MESLLRDLGLACRGLGRSPGFAAVAVLTLALGVGATTTVVSAVYGVLFRPLPFPGADRLVQIVQLRDGADGGTRRGGWSFGQFYNLQEHATTLSAVGMFVSAPRTITDVPVPARLNGASVLPGLFEGIGAQSLHKPAEYDDPDATANANLGARLPYLFACCRFAHYLKCIVRDKIGSFKERADMQRWLPHCLSRW